MTPLRRTLTTLGLCAALGGTAGAPAARASDDDDRREVRVSGSCGRGATAKLRVRARDGRMDIRFEVDRNRAGELWRVVLTREGRVVARTRARTSGSGGAFSVERRIADYPGADRVTARAVNGRGLTCTAAATLRG